MRSEVTKRRFVQLALGGLSAFALPGISSATAEILQLRGFGSGGIQPVSVAVMSMSGGGRDLSGIISNDLSRSGLFQPIDPKAFVEQVGPNATPNFASW